MTASDTMGHTIARFEFRAPGRKRSLALDLLVDTGSTYTWIDARVLRDLGIVPSGRWTFETIEGREASRRLGEAVVSYSAVQATTIVVFARRKDAQVLGVHALEGLRLAVDPATKRLRRLRSVLAVLGRDRESRQRVRAAMGSLPGPDDFSDLAGTVQWRKTAQEYKDELRRLAETRHPRGRPDTSA